MRSGIGHGDGGEGEADDCEDGDGNLANDFIEATIVDNGIQHQCAVLTNGTAACWGHNYYGQIGDGTVGTSRYVPSSVLLPSGKQARSISHGNSNDAHHICAVMTDDSLYCWGHNFYGQIGDGTTTDLALVTRR